jgi:hypothetical protein
MTQFKIVSASTAFPNTLETDTIPLIPIAVTYGLDTKTTRSVVILAREPGDAIDLARKMTISELSALPTLESFEKPVSTSNHQEYLKWFLNQVSKLANN